MLRLLLLSRRLPRLKTLGCQGIAHSIGVASSGPVSGRLRLHVLPNPLHSPGETLPRFSILSDAVLVSLVDASGIDVRPRLEAVGSALRLHLYERFAGGRALSLTAGRSKTARYDER